MGKKSVQIILQLVFAVVVLGLGYWVYTLISTPIKFENEQKAREAIDRRLEQPGWIIQDMARLNLTAGLGVAVREFPTSTGPVDNAFFVDDGPVDVVEAKKDKAGEDLFAVES